MKLIPLHSLNGKEVFINVEKIIQIFELVNDDTIWTRILFCLKVGNDYAYEDVKETTNEIISMCEYKPN